MNKEKTTSLLSRKSKENKLDKESYTPSFFRLENIDDKNRLSSLINNNQNIIIIDEIEGQVGELIKSLNPQKKYSEDELNDSINNHLGTTIKEEYGVWVYYPWSNRLIHILDEEEFVTVRTNRNQYKITPEEKEVLSEKKIGVIGLSVGKAIALTIAMERICGEIRLADFDVIELSNLNRIQTGTHNLEVKKAIVVAREIAEIDPFLKVTCYLNGVTEENIDDFFLKDGKLDLCLEESDGLYIKIFTRQKAKELGIPVVMNSSDRGTTDIERYDLNPELPIMHGLIDHLDISKIKEAKTNEEKVPYLLPMLGVDTSSERLKASMIEIEQTITTWPQLASGVILGGGISADVCRRILLNQLTISGRYFVDLEEIIGNEQKSSLEKNIPDSESPLIPETNLSDYQPLIDDLQKEEKVLTDESSIDLSIDQVKELVRTATYAPSGGNVQPWKWLYKNKKLLLLNDNNRSDSILNYKNSASHMAFGAATENLVLKSHSLDIDVRVDQFPFGVENDLIASFNFYPSSKGSNDCEGHANDELVDEIFKRTTNRTISKRSEVTPDKLTRLSNIVKSFENINLDFFTDEKKLNEIRDIIAMVDQLYITNKSGHSHFNREIRWNKQEVETTKDGIDIRTIDLTPTEKAGFIVSKNWNVTRHLKKWKMGKAYGKLTRKAINGSFSVGLVTISNFNPENCFESGRLIQRVWLEATKMGIAFQPMSISSFLFSRINDDNFDNLEDIKDELLSLKRKFEDVCEINDDRHNIFLFRLFEANDMKIKALRREVDDVLMFDNDSRE